VDAIDGEPVVVSALSTGVSCSGAHAAGRAFSAPGPHCGIYGLRGDRWETGCRLWQPSEIVVTDLFDEALAIAGRNGCHGCGQCQDK
jgi:hypothetical protein